jgi:hypothetical protein
MYTHKGLNQVGFKITLQVGQKHLQGFNNVKIHQLQLNQQEVGFKTEKIKVFLVFWTIFPSILTKNLSQQ